MTAATLPLAREGFHAPGIGIFEWPDIVHLQIGGIDLSINRVVLQMFVVVLLVWGLFYLAFRRPRLVPSGLQNVMEFFVDFIRNQIVLEVIGRDGLRRTSWDGKTGYLDSSSWYICMYSFAGACQLKSHCMSRCASAFHSSRAL